MAPSAPFTLNSASFNPNIFFDAANLSGTSFHLQRNDLAAAITSIFALPSHDHYVYHATASITLAQAQAAVAAGPTNRLHDWYLVPEETDSGTVAAYPPPTDIAAYIGLFDASKFAANSLKSLLANAKKGSLRLGIAKWLTERRYLDPSIVVLKRKTPGSFVNPYFLFWSWSCHSLQYAGPNADTGKQLKAHHILPIFMHHFACACPSYEALEIIAIVSKGKTVLDIGSGTGYWTLMLRRQGCDVIAVDSQQSVYRTCWIEDTIKADGVDFIAKTRSGGREDVLLMVYPIVSGDFTRKAIEAFQGQTICVAGTQNGNGYTGFEDAVIDEWMEREKGEEWNMLARVPLPSFAGKDDALFVFRRR